MLKGKQLTSYNYRHIPSSVLRLTNKNNLSITTCRPKYRLFENIIIKRIHIFILISLCDMSSIKMNTKRTIQNTTQKIQPKNHLRKQKSGKTFCRDVKS